jgi:amino acid transporter
MDAPQPALQRHFGLLQATALNVTMIVGAGVFITIPLMLKALPGPYAVLGWLAGGALMLFDGLIWCELGATLPGSGGSYLYLLECYGRERWGRLMAFLFIWQFLISGPLEIASGLIAIGVFARGLHPSLPNIVNEWTTTWKWQQTDLSVSFGPAQVLYLSIGIVILALLYRRITVLAKWTILFWVGVMAAIAWILIDGALHFQPQVAFDTAGIDLPPAKLATGLGPAMLMAMYSYLGYYNICYIGDEVHNPGRTIPWSILLSAVLVCLLFTGVHLAMLGTVPWSSVPADDGNYSLPAAFMTRLHSSWAATLLSVLLIGSCMGSAFAGLLGYSRIPYGAARYGHFFSRFARIHPIHHIPHVSLLWVGALTLFWSFFDLENVIKALLATRILEQFVAQVFAVILLRNQQPERPRPFKIWLYPLPCGLALVGWLFMYVSAGTIFIWLSLGTLTLGAVAFLVWSRQTSTWPFEGKLKIEN